MNRLADLRTPGRFLKTQVTFGCSGMPHLPGMWNLVPRLIFRP